MEDIKTVALKVARETVPYTWISEDYPQAGLTGSNKERLLQFAYRLLAELQKDATPVAWLSPATEFSPPLAYSNHECDDEHRKTYTPLYAHPKAATVPEGFADQLLGKIDTLIAHVNEAHTAKSKEWAEANFQAADIALEKITEMVRACAAPSLPAQSEAPKKSHRWDGAGERCLDCGDKDWFAGPHCTAQSEGEQK